MSVLIAKDCTPLFTRTAEAVKSVLRREIVEACLEGKVVRLDGAGLGVGPEDFDMTEVFPHTLCKVGVLTELQPVAFDYHQALPYRLVCPGAAYREDPYLSEAEFNGVCERSFDGDWPRFDRFLNACRTGETALRAIAAEVLGDHDFYNDSVVLRFSAPEQTKLHYDPTPNIERKECIRFFVNLDDKPRRWETSITLPEFVEREYERLDLGRFFTMDAPNRMAVLVKRIMATPEFLAEPRTVIDFEPGAIWAFDGRLLAHELIHGDRALSVGAKIMPQTLPVYHTSLKDRLFAIHERKAGRIPTAPERTAALAMH